MTRPRIIRTRRGRTTSIGRPKVTFAKMALTDFNSWTGRGPWRGMKRVWTRRAGFVDVTPRTAKGRPVPALKGKIVETVGRKFLADFSEVVANWYLIGGHHGRIFAWCKVCGHVPAKCRCGDIHAGFFNHDYHELQWGMGFQGDPAPWDHPDSYHPSHHPDRASDYARYHDSLTRMMKKHPPKHGVYLRTGKPMSGRVAAFDQSNPLFDVDNKSLQYVMPRLRRKQCKGIILAGCNGLTYPSDRAQWNRRFPDSVIFGALRVVGYGSWITNAVIRSPTLRKRRRDFWRDPGTVLKSEDDVRRLCKELSNSFPHRRHGTGIGVQYRGWFYYSKKGRRHRTIVKGEV